MRPSRKLLVFTLAYLIFLAVLALFLDRAVSFDERLFSAVYGLGNPSLEVFFSIITNLGSTIFWIIVIILFWLKGKKEISLRLFFVLILDAISITILKWTFLRPRPFGNFQGGIDLDLGPSFPSGHSQTVFSGAVVLSHYYKKYSALFYLLAVLTALSRIFLGLHYPLDVLVGAINGIIVGWSVLLIPNKKIEKIKASVHKI